MLDLTVIILTKDEKLHIARCLERLLPLEPRRILVVDCFSTDGTQEMVESFSRVEREERVEIEVVEHNWPGNQAEQFNWALDNCAIDTEWILRIDADEYLSPEAVKEVKEALPSASPDVSAYAIGRYAVWQGRVMRHGSGKVLLTRIFRKGKGRSEVRLMDEHIVISDGKTQVLRHPFFDENVKDFEDWTKKHLNYALREALDLLRMEYAPAEAESAHLNASASAKRAKKSKYARLPLFWRSFAYFLYRYILRGGFRDGRAGFTWNFFQGWWYRTMVDARILEIKRATGAEQNREHAWERIRAYARERGLRI
jgi:glycosyltransferase involved in cell wall biosynthesis